MKGNVLTGEAALLYAERTGRGLRVSDVKDVRVATVRKMLEKQPAARALILEMTSIEVPTGAT